MNATLINYAHICRRKAWLHRHGLRMEQESEAVQLGRLVDERSYGRERKGLDLLATLPDGTQLTGKVDWANLREGVLHETKKGKACEEAHIWQVRFYLWLLRLCEVVGPDGQAFTGVLNYPRLRRTEKVVLLETHERELAELVAELSKMLRQDQPPPRIAQRTFCRKCAFEEMCFG
jgi:CRISPR-associated exonuclease Cas4